jgi:hypothetical protein
VTKSRLVRVLGEEEAGLLVDRLFAGALTTVDCILIEWLLRPRGRRRVPKVVREQVAMKTVSAYKKLRARRGHEGVRKNALADMPGNVSLRTIERSQAIIRRKGERVVVASKQKDDPR